MSNASQPRTSRPDIARFSTVDDTNQPRELIEFLEVAKAAPAMRAAKEEVLEWLEPERASNALDVGCGYGADVVALAERMGPGGRAVGVDVSEAMISEARQRTMGRGPVVSFQIGDANDLPFENDTFDVCRIETVLQHLPEPARATAEMVRVTRPGGRIAAFEFDQATLFMDHQDVELAELIRATLANGMTQGAIGRQLQRLFAQAGVTDVCATPRVISQDPSFFRLMLGRPVTGLLDAGVITSARADGWWRAMDEAARAGHFTNGATAFVVCGTVP
jgi:ubiquinone/menaquinone biosynthesis C-methylase UbiE